MRSIKLVTLLGIALLASSVGCKDKVGVPSKGTRPAGTGTEQQEAYVLMVQGVVGVDPAVGEDFTAEVGQGLYRSDTLRTGDDAFLVLKLKNNYLVRLDEELKLAVNDIVLINSKATKRDFREQLERLLSDDEETVAERDGVYQRIAGWHSEREAMETVPSREAAPAAAPQMGKDEAAPTRMAEKEMDGFASAKEERPTLQEAPAQPEPSEKMERPARPARRRAAPGARRAEGAGRSADDKDLSDLLPKGETAAESGAAADPAVAPAPASGRLEEDEPTPGPDDAREQLKQKLQGCMASWAEEQGLPIGGRKITLRWLWKGGALTRVWIDGALPTPDCARDQVMAFLTRTGASDGEGRVEVILP